MSIWLTRSSVSVERDGLEICAIKVSDCFVVRVLDLFRRIKCDEKIITIDEKKK